MRFPTMSFGLPAWVEESLADAPDVYPTVEKRMQFVIGLAQGNVENATGGPFGAGIFDAESGRLLAPGVNTVIQSGCSVMHAEISAIMLAQRMAGGYDLGAEGMGAYELVTSTEPCAMCLGAVVWSGVRRLVCGARDEDARAIGFDEGPKPSGWVDALAGRGITVVRDVCRDEAFSVLRRYAECGGVIYNARQGGPR